jgi:hypothetical protein
MQKAARLISSIIQLDKILAQDEETEEWEYSGKFKK